MFISNDNREDITSKHVFVFILELTFPVCWDREFSFWLVIWESTISLISFTLILNLC